MELNELKEEFEKAKTLPKQQMNVRLADLMTELEQKHGAMILYPTEEQLQSETIKLYQAISSTRNFE